MPPSAYDTVASIHFVAKFFGIYLFSINPRTYEAEFKVADLLLATVAIPFYASVVYVYYTFAIDDLIINSQIIARGVPFMMTMQIAVFSVLILLSNVKRRDFSEMLHSLVDIDKSFEYFGIKIDYRVHGATVRWTLVKVFTWISSLTVISALLQLLNPQFVHRTEEYVFFFWGIGIAAIVMLSFKFSVVGIGRRFEKVNDILRSLIPPSSSQFFHHEFSVAKLRRLSSIHLRLATTIKIVNRTFSIALMLYFFVFFCWFCILLFIATKATSATIANFHAFVVPRFLLNLTLDALMLSSLKSANDATKEGKRTREVLFRMRSDCWHEGVSHEIGNFIEQVQFTPTHYTCGLFAFDWKFVFNFMSTVLMYLVILIQFESSLQDCRDEIKIVACGPNATNSSDA